VTRRARAAQWVGFGAACGAERNTSARGGGGLSSARGVAGRERAAATVAARRQGSAKPAGARAQARSGAPSTLHPRGGASEARRAHGWGRAREQQRSERWWGA